MSRPIDADTLFAEIKERYDMFADCEYIGDKARRDELGSFMADIVNAPTIGGWISVENRLPETETDVLAFLNDGIETRVAACNFANGVWYDCVMNCIVVMQHVTHWMPLPEPPEVEHE